MPTHTSATIPQNLELYKDRQKNVNLIWCNQVISIIERLFLDVKVSINDIGCNYGQLLKEIHRRDLDNKIDYYGYDIDSVSLNMAKTAFASSANKFFLFDVETDHLPTRDVTICSATFEHLDKPINSLNKMLQSTSKYIILRTFVGEETIYFEQNDKNFVDIPYNIKQFNLFEIAKVFMQNGFTFCCHKDEATGSIPKEIESSSGIFRTTFIIIGSRQKTFR